VQKKTAATPRRAAHVAGEVVDLILAD
jgi:hypothetical protein